VAAGDLIVNDVPLSDVSAEVTVNDALAAWNSDLDGKGASVSSLVQYVADGTGSGVLRAPAETLTIDYVDGDGLTQTYTLTGTGNMKELVDKINAETALEATLNTEGKLVLTAEGATSITITDISTGGGASGAGVTTPVVTNFSLVFNDTSVDKKGVIIEAGATLTAAQIDDLGIDVNDTDGNLLGTVVAGAAAVLQEGDLIINNVAIGKITGTGTAATDLAEAIRVINLSSGESGVVAFAGAGGEIALRSANGEEIAIKYGDTATVADVLAITGFQERNATEGVGSVASIKIDTYEGAQKAIGIVDKALEQVNATRADLGAVNNRLDFTMSNLANVSEKTSASRSRIIDADFAAETAALSRAQVLQQAATAMLAQSNARPEQVLTLLR
jgi:flagellin